MKFAFALFLISPAALASGNHEIKGFHFANCGQHACVEVWADKGFLSQLQFAFATDGATTVKVTDLESKKELIWTGSASSLNPSLKLITLDQPNSSTVLISLDDFKAETIAGKTAP